MLDRYLLGEKNIWYGKHHTDDSIKIMKEKVNKRFSDPKEREKTSTATKMAMNKPEIKEKMIYFNIKISYRLFIDIKYNILIYGRNNT